MMARFLIDGLMPVDDARELLGLPQIAPGAYRTLAGFVLFRMGHIPVPGEYFVHENWRLEVVDMDGRRIDKILAQRHPPPGDRTADADRDATTPAGTNIPD
jgi:putative hemolysin